MQCKPKRVAVVDPSSYTLPYDYFFIRRLASEMQVDFYCSKTEFNWDFAQALLAVSGVRVFSWKVSGVGRIRGGWSYLRMLIRLWRDRNLYEYIHFQWQILRGPLALLELAFMWLVRRKLVFTCHNPVPHSFRRGRTYWVFCVINRIARRMVFVSEFSMEQFEKAYGPVTNGLVVQHGLLPVSPEEPDTVRGEEDVSTCRFDGTVVYWGNVKPYKGVGFLAELAACDMMDGQRIEVYGKWDSDMDAERERLLSAGVHIFDRFLPADELKMLLSRAAVFIFPYRDISQSGVLYTYLRYGCVCVSTDMGDNGCFFRRHGLDRLLFEPGDVEGAAAAVTYAVCHYAALRERMKEIRPRYSWEAVLPDPVQVYSMPPGTLGKDREMV